MWELDCKESWAPKNWCFWTMVLEKTLESPLDYKEIQPVHPKGDQSWVFIGRTDAESETLVLWVPHGRVDSLEKTLILGWIWGRRRKGWQRKGRRALVWVNSRSLWWTGRPGMLQFMGSQTVGHDWVIELNWTEHSQIFGYTKTFLAKQFANPQLPPESFLVLSPLSTHLFLRHLLGLLSYLLLHVYK